MALKLCILQFEDLFYGENVRHNTDSDKKYIVVDEDIIMIDAQVIREIKV